MKVFVTINLEKPKVNTETVAPSNLNKHPSSKSIYLKAITILNSTTSRKTGKT